MDIYDWVCLLVARAHDTAMFRCLVIMNMRFEYECYSNQYEKRKHTCASSLSFRSAEMLSDTWTICHDTGVWMWMGLYLHINDSFACITHTHGGFVRSLQKYYIFPDCRIFPVCGNNFFFWFNSNLKCSPGFCACYQIELLWMRLGECNSLHL